MSSIIDAKPFNDVFPATRNNSKMQGTVTAIYEVGTSYSINLISMVIISLLTDV